MYDLTDPTKRRLLAGTAFEFLQLDPRNFIDDQDELKHYLPRDENFAPGAVIRGAR